MEFEFDIEGFSDCFEGTTVTLMDGRSLRREFALLRAALPPELHGQREASNSREQAFDLAQKIAAQLPPAPPTCVSALRCALASWRCPQSHMHRVLIREAWRTVLQAEQHTKLFLVPAVWPLRMMNTLDGTLYPASIRYFHRWRPASS